MYAKKLINYHDYCFFVFITYDNNTQKRVLIYEEFRIIGNIRTHIGVLESFYSHINTK